jgi:N-acyl-D-aspartate/D-glutamate deacylase
MIREENLMPLMLALSKMTYMPAKFLQDNGIPQLAHKGRLQVGADADITVIDPNTVKQNATPANGRLASTGSLRRGQRRDRRQGLEGPEGCFSGQANQVAVKHEGPDA